MSKTDFYRQCTLQRGNITQVSHIPAKYATVGGIVQLRREDGVWENGWEILQAGDLRPAAAVEAGERDYLKTRQHSDI